MTACTSFPDICTAFPTISMYTPLMQVIEFPTAWRDSIDDEGELPIGEVVYLVDKDGNLLLDASGKYLTVSA